MINLHRFDPVSLKLFVTSVDAGSLTAGARKSGISLAAASKRVADLEHHFQIALLVRSKRGVVATAAGQSLYQQALEVLARLEQMALSMQDFESGATGQLRLWANTTAFGGFLPEVLACYASLYPGISLDLQDVLSEEAVRAVSTGVTELAIIGDNTRFGDLQTMVCEQDDLVLVLPPDHPLLAGDQVGLEQALEYNFISLARSSSLTRLLSAQAEALNKPLQVRIQVRSFEAMCQMVAAGLGVAIVPSRIALSHARALQLHVRAFGGQPMQRRLLLVMRSSAQLSRPAQGFVELVQARFAHVSRSPSSPLSGVCGP